MQVIRIQTILPPMSRLVFEPTKEFLLLETLSKGPHIYSAKNCCGNI